MKNRVKSSKIELRFREIRSEGRSSRAAVLQALRFFVSRTVLRSNRSKAPENHWFSGAFLKICPIDRSHSILKRRPLHLFILRRDYTAVYLFYLVPGRFAAPRHHCPKRSHSFSTALSQSAENLPSHANVKGSQEFRLTQNTLTQTSPAYRLRSITKSSFDCAAASVRSERV